jgi:hypothetical protein
MKMSYTMFNYDILPTGRPICEVCYSIHSTESCLQHMESYGTQKKYIVRTIHEYFNEISITLTSIKKLRVFNYLTKFMIENYYFIRTGDFAQESTRTRYLTSAYNKMEEFCLNPPECLDESDTAVVEDFYNVSRNIKSQIMNDIVIVV